jgi:hypothetical protein
MHEYHKPNSTADLYVLFLLRTANRLRIIFAQKYVDQAPCRVCIGCASFYTRQINYLFVYGQCYDAIPTKKTSSEILVYVVTLMAFSNIERV